MKKLYKNHKIYTFVLLISIVYLTSCGQNQSSTGSEGTWKIGLGDLSDSIGHINTVETGNNELLQHGFFTDDFELWNKLGYNAPSGKWFYHNGEGLLGYGLTMGTHKSGDKVTVTLIGHKDDGEQLNRDVHIQFTEINGNVDKKEILKEEILHVDSVGHNDIIFTSTLPEKENAAYVLSAEILNVSGNVEDTRISVIYVPKEEMNAYLSTDQSVYVKDETEAKLTLTNYGPTLLTLGKSYHIEKKVKEEWRIVPLALDFPAIGIILLVGEQHEQTVDLTQLDEGKYRVIKEFGVEGFDLSATLAAEFTIE